MSLQGLYHRTQGLFWEHNRPLRALAKRFRKSLSKTAYRARAEVSPNLPPKVIADLVSDSARRLTDPAIRALVSEDLDPSDIQRFRAEQTEPSVAWDPQGPGGEEFVFHLSESTSSAPATLLESMLMAAVAQDLDWVVGGWAEPAPGPYGPFGRVAPINPNDPASSLLLRLVQTGREHRKPLPGRAVPHICDPERLHDLEPNTEPFSRTSGPDRLSYEVSPGSIVRSKVHVIDEALGDLPPIEGPRSALFLLPYLAVGGAERLLLDLVRGLAGRYRILIATTDPHLQSLGQTVDRFREHTPNVYTLGDWLPREAVPSALRHLVRRWRVETLVSWNGTVEFYDHAEDFKRRFPSLRILNQLYNHRGGWIEHYCPSLIRSTDLHLAVNTPIASALERERGVPAVSIRTIFHGVQIDDESVNGPDDNLKAERRAEIGLPATGLLVGTFIRMHPQKRPLDVIRVARRMAAEEVHFLLVGGGELDSQVDRELARSPVPNLTRLPMQNDARKLYDALDLCLLTSSFEGLPVFLLDGLARGLPCVAPAVGDIPLLLENGGGVVVERPGDIDALASGIHRLMDDDLRRSEARRGHAAVRSRFGLDRYVRAYEDAIFPER